MIRKSVAIAASVLFCLGLPAMALGAPGGAYALDALGISIAMPENTAVFTRDTAENDPDLAFISYTQKELLELYGEQDIYLEAIDENWEYSITVTMTGNSYVSMSVFDEGELEDAMESIRTGYAGDGARVASCEPYDSGSAVFLKIDYTYTEDNYTDFVVEYYTIYNNMNISVTLFSFMGGVTLEQEALIKGIVDGIRYDAGDPKAETGKPNKRWDIAEAAPYIGLVVSALVSILIRNAAKRAQAKKKKQETIPQGAFADGGASVPPESYSAELDARLSNIGAQDAAQARRCPHCNEALEPGSVFCGRCGARVE